MDERAQDVGGGVLSSSDGTEGGAGAETKGRPAERCDENADAWGDDAEEGGDAGEDTTYGMGDDMPLRTTIPDVQRGRISTRERIALPGVVLISPSAEEGVVTGFEVFVQDPLGGPFSGLRVHTDTFDPSELFVPGDAVDIVGRLSSQDGFYLLNVETIDDVTFVDAGEVPPPVVLSASELRATDPTARPYEGITVRVEDVVVTDPRPCEGEFVIDDTVRVDDRFVPHALPAPEEGQILTAVEGVLIYAFDRYELAPPSADAVE